MFDIVSLVYVGETDEDHRAVEERNKNADIMLV